MVDSQGSKTISIEAHFSVGTLVLFGFVFLTSTTPCFHGHVSSFPDHYSEVLQLYSSQSGLGLLG